jgi:hypothetical protein
VIIAAAGCGLFTLYFCQSRTAPFNSDGAANVLQGQAIVTGNPLLHGWWTSDVSFYTTELPEYALVTAIHGLSPDVVHRCGALTYTLTVLLAALAARGSAVGRAAWCRAGISAGIMLSPSILGGTEVFLENPDHAGTAVPVLLVVLLLGRAAPRRARLSHRAGPTAKSGRTADTPVGTRVPWAARWHGWLLPAGACALLALAQVGDELTLVAATVPLAVVSAIRLATSGWGRSGQRRREEALPDGALPDGALLIAAAVSVGLAKLAYLMIRARGGFDVRPLGGVALAPLSQVKANASVLWHSLILLFGANNPGTPHQAQTIRAHAFLVGMADLHVIGLLLAGAGLAAGIASLLSRHADRGTQFLVAAIIAVLAAGVFTTVLRSLSNAHEVAILLPLGAVLIGRLLPRLAGRLSARLRPVSLPVPAFLPWSGWPSGPGAARWRRVGIADLTVGAWLALSLTELCYAATWAAVPSPQQAVAAWLASHHEHEGLSGYWQADATTVTSGGQVLVAPITLPTTAEVEGIPSFSRNRARDAPLRPTRNRYTLPTAAGNAQAIQAQPGHAHKGGKAEADRWESSAAWYQPGQRQANFVIAVTGPAAADGLSPTAVRGSFGPPAAEHRVGQDLIMLYDYNLLTRLTGTSFPGSS